jgi:hypothetical protein
MRDYSTPDVAARAAAVLTAIKKALKAEKIKVMDYGDGYSGFYVECGAFCPACHALARAREEAKS